MLYEWNRETQDLILDISLYSVCWRRSIVRGLPLPNRPDADRHKWSLNGCCCCILAMFRCETKRKTFGFETEITIF